MKSVVQLRQAKECEKQRRKCGAALQSRCTIAPWGQSQFALQKGVAERGDSNGSGRRAARFAKTGGAVGAL